MLKELRLENYRGFDNHIIPFKELNVIVGANNAGKSTVVEVLRILSLIVNRYKNLTYKPVPAWLAISGKNYGVSPSLRNAEINFDSVCNQYNNDEPAIISGVFSDGNIVTVYLNSDGELHGVINTSKGKVISSRKDSNKVELPTINILPQVAPVQRDEFELDSDYVKSAIGSSISPLHFRNQISLFYSLFPTFQKLVAETWPGVMVLQLMKGDDPIKKQLFLQVRNDNFVAEICAMGHGLQMWLQVIWFLTLFSNSAIIILDEPDVYMHADLQKRLIRLIQNKFPQVIITTHSIEIMSEVQPDDILVIDKNSKKSSFAIDIPAVQKVVETTGSYHNINLSRLWRAHKFLMIEGKDLKFLKSIQNKLFPKSLYPIDSIPNMSINGWGGWSYAVGTSMFLFNAFKEKLIIYSIMDSDYHTASEIQTRIEEAKQKGIDLHIWQKKEIENYFIIASSIRRLIIHRSKADLSPSLQEIEKEISRICNSLKEYVTDCIADEILQRDRSRGLQNANREARKYIKGIESVEGTILSIASGKEIISRLSKWSQSNFQVSISIQGIINMLHVGEIDREMINLMFAIENGQSFSDSE